MQVVITGDTHLPKGGRELPAALQGAIAGATLVIHSGDFTGAGSLERFERISPRLVAVHGNVDVEAVVQRLPEATAFDLGAARVGLIHDAGPRRGRMRRMRRLFPDADAVVFGHSHLPLHEIGEDGFQIFNPGSPTERRRAPTHSFGLCEPGPDGRLRFKHVRL